MILGNPQHLLLTIWASPSSPYSLMYFLILDIQRAFLRKDSLNDVIHRLRMLDMSRRHHFRGNSAEAPGQLVLAHISRRIINNVKDRVCSIPDTSMFSSFVRSSIEVSEERHTRRHALLNDCRTRPIEFTAFTATPAIMRSKAKHFDE
jgi:hypothetical protein